MFRRGAGEVKVCMIANLSVREFVYDAFCVSSCEFTTFRQCECFSMFMRVHVILRVRNADQVKLNISVLM